MTDEVENLVLEHLRAIRGDMASMKDDIRTLRVEVTAMRQIMSATVLMQEHDHGDIAGIKARIERIERRLDLVD